MAKAGLCKARHEMPVDMFVYPHEVADLMDFRSIERRARMFLMRAGLVSPGDTLVLYVTGATPLFAAVVKACAQAQVHLEAEHWDRTSQSYVRQHVL